MLVASWVVLREVGSRIERNGATRSAQEAANCRQDSDLRNVWDQFSVIRVAFWLTSAKSKNFEKPAFLTRVTFLQRNWHTLDQERGELCRPEKCWFRMPE